MSGPFNGAAALITAQYPLALYLHCTSHCLNLAVVKSVQVTSVCNMTGVVDRVCQCFVSHPKQQRALEDAILSTQPDTAVFKVKDLCRTRWVQRIDALYKCLSLSTHPLWLAWKEFVMMVQGYGLQTHLLMLGVYC